MDVRGISRGSCSACGCSSYDGGTVGMKCVNCGHPPGRHQNLSTGSSLMTSVSSSSSLSGLRPVSASAAAFSIGPVCQYPGCVKPVYFDMNTSFEYTSCRDHIGIPLPAQSAFVSPSGSCIFSPSSSSSSLGNGGLFSPLFGYFNPHQQTAPAQLPHQSLSFPQAPATVPQLTPGPPSAVSLQPNTPQQTTAPLLPPDQRCKVEGCLRPRFQEPGSNGKLHEFCGRTHALLYNQQQAKKAGNVNPKLKCKTPGCPRQRYPLSDGSGHYDFCSLNCRNMQRILTSASTPNLSSAGVSTCSLPGCGLPNYVDPANGRVHDYCCRSHAFQAQQQGIVVNPPTATLGIQKASQQELTSVQSKFQQMWASAKGPCPALHCVFVVTNQSLLARWQTYRQKLNNKTVEEHYHGTKVTCDITNTQKLCSNQNCGACGISSTGFDRRCIQKNINFQRFGNGFYLASNSSKCHDYTQGFNGYRVMLLCDVCPGNKYTLKKDNQHLTSPPQGYDSVHGQPGVRLNYEEIVLYQPDAILPKYIIVYQKNGIGKIAK